MSTDVAVPPETAAGAARPVTPLAILSAELSALAVDPAVASLPAQARRRLERARDLAAGLDPYVEACTSPASAALTSLARRTAGTDWVATDHVVPLEQEMLSGHVEGETLAMLVHLARARRVLEVGMFTGYSALAMAEALQEVARLDRSQAPSGEQPGDGPGDRYLVACELDPAVAAVARECLTASPAGAWVRVEVGPAADTLRRLASAGESFDLVFVDADKAGYADYVDLVLDGGLLAPHGLIAVDNTLLQGEPYLDREPSPNGAAVAGFNAWLTADPRVRQVLLPVRDGLTLVRRAPAGHDRPASGRS